MERLTPCLEALLLCCDDYSPPDVRIRITGQILPLDTFEIPGCIKRGDLLLVRIAPHDKSESPRVSFVGGPIVLGVKPLNLRELLDLFVVGGVPWGELVAIARRNISTSLPGDRFPAALRVELKTLGHEIGEPVEDFRFD